jgi:two-component system, OmpR family, response regulator
VSQGFAFFGFGSGAECLDLAARISPSLIILDVEMPGMNGFETCRRLRARVQSKSVPVAFYTAHRTDADFRRGLDAGGNDFLLKPIDPEKLISRVLRWTETPHTLPKPRKPVANIPPGAALWADQ